ncbi:ATPase [Galbitalea sp. SE-J8]|uniref:ATP-binding protein n=1 Tax=Galbitalea sp. SE-J8 TaxID=3054952 RepID=UPI00259D25E7|nr:ATPase [Galbitalea sp. SE-J8]MDM4761832.1 ATPase [Galbitalea sp. SE-J8]
MKIAALGGLRIEHDGAPVVVTGAMQLAVLFRLALDAGHAVGYRAIAEDVWGLDAPENVRAALQSVVSRLRAQLPPGVIESTPGGYRLRIERADVDVLALQDAADAASRSAGHVGGALASGPPWSGVPASRVPAAGAPATGALASEAAAALARWTGEPWLPSDGFDWVAADVARDRATLAAIAARPDPDAAPTGSDRAIPVPLTELVGREAERGAIAAQLDRGRLVTLLGPGGSGKTRLAIETARGATRLAVETTRGAGRAVLVELAPVGAGEVLAAVLAATGRAVRTESSDPVPLRGRVIDALAGRLVLLVVDNCEHVVAEAAEVVADLLSALPDLRVLATSREPLGVAGEAFVPIGPLPHPEGDETGDPEDYDAVRLFRDRAVAATGAPLGDLATAARICARLDGLPLALELAAARLRTMTLDEVLAGLESRFALLTTGPRTALPHHQTLRAMIDWSWSLLGADERRALAWLSVYPGGVAAADAAPVAASMGVDDPGVFDALVDRSLLQRSRGRFRALETIREYGLDVLDTAGETDAARRAFVDRMAACAADADDIIRGPGIHDALAWFDAEDDNVSQALRVAASLPAPQAAVDLMVSCMWASIIREREELARSFMAIVALAPEVDTPAGRMLARLGPILAAMTEGAPPDAVDPEMADVLRAIAEDARGDDGGSDLLQLVPVVVDAFAGAAAEGDWPNGVELPAVDELGLRPWPTAFLHLFAAVLSQNRGDMTTLGTESAVALAAFEQLGDSWGLAIAQQFRAEWLRLTGRLDEALALCESALGNMARITPPWDLAQLQGTAIDLLARLGRTDEAERRARELLAAAQDGGHARTLVQARATLASVALARGDAVAAREQLDSIDSPDRLEPTFERAPHQLAALLFADEAWCAVLEGDLDAAEAAARSAARSAVESHDQPVMGSVALVAGLVALERGDVRRALEAVDVASALTGVTDATHPIVIRIEATASRRGIERTRRTLSRPLAVEALDRLT